MKDDGMTDDEFLQFFGRLDTPCKVALFEIGMSELRVLRRAAKACGMETSDWIMRCLKRAACEDLTDWDFGFGYSEAGVEAFWAKALGAQDGI